MKEQKDKGNVRLLALLFMAAAIFACVPEKDTEAQANLDTPQQAVPLKESEGQANRFFSEKWSYIDEAEDRFESYYSRYLMIENKDISASLEKEAKITKIKIDLKKHADRAKNELQELKRSHANEWREARREFEVAMNNFVSTYEYAVNQLPSE